MRMLALTAGSPVLMPRVLMKPMHITVICCGLAGGERSSPQEVEHAATRGVGGVADLDLIGKRGGHAVLLVHDVRLAAHLDEGLHLGGLLNNRHRLTHPTIPYILWFWCRIDV